MILIFGILSKYINVNVIFILYNKSIHLTNG